MKSLNFKEKKIFIVLLIFNCLTINYVNAQWQQINQGIPSNSKVYASLLCEDNFFVGTNFGLYISKDKGKNWEIVNTGKSTHLPVYSLGRCNIFLFIGTSEGANMSRDGGYTWKDINVNISKWFMFPKVPIWSFESNETDIFVTTPAGIYSSEYNIKSDDCDMTWEDNNEGMPYFTNVNTIITNDSKLLAGTDIGIFVSSNNGKSWTRTGYGFPNVFVRTLTVKGNKIFAGTKDNGIYISDDNGLNWKSSNDGLTNKSINSILIYGNKIIAGTNEGLFLSNDEGKNWHEFNHGFIKNKVFALEASSSELYVGTIGEGLWTLPLCELD